MSEKPKDPWFERVMKRLAADNCEPAPTSDGEAKSALKPSEPQQTLADLYEEWSDSVPPENRAEFLKLANRLKQLSHDTNDPLALILYTIGTSNKIHLLLPHKIQKACQSIVHDLDGRMEKIRGLHDQAIDKLGQVQIKLVSEYGALCDLTILRAKQALNTHLADVDTRGVKLYSILDQETNNLKKIQIALVDAVTKLLAKPIEQSKQNDALLKHVHEVVARIDVLFHKTYRTILLTFGALVIGAFIAGMIARSWL